MGLTKRQMMFVPKMYPNSTFVLFFEKGDTGLSWSIRDYSEKGSPKTYGRSDFGWPADQVRKEAKYSFDAPAVDTNETDYWHERTLEYNTTYLGGNAELKPSPHLPVEGPPAKRTPKEIIDEFLALHPDNIYTKQDLADKASAYKKKVDGAKVSAASISRIYTGNRVGPLIRTSVASVIDPFVRCTANDLLPLD